MSGRMEFLCATHPPIEGLRHQQSNVTVHIERENLAKGTLFIAESYVSWINGSGQGFTVPYPAISVHAVSRNLTSYPHECLYLMIDTAVMSEILQIPSSKEAGGAGDDGDQDEAGEEDESIRELRFIPDDKQALEKMFTVMSDCQTLHPDPDDSEPSDEDYGDEFDDAEEDQGVVEEAEEEDGSRVGEVAGQDMQGQRPGASQNGHVDSSMIKMASQSADASGRDEAMDTGQFADADMEQDP